MSIAKRGRLYHLRRCVPRRYRRIEPRETVWISLHTDSETAATSRAVCAWSQIIEVWKCRLAGNSEDVEARYEAARDLARARGFRYLDAGAVARLPVGDVVERVEAIAWSANPPDGIQAAALFGTVREPRTTVTQALVPYWTLAREKTFGKSEGQLRRWEALRRKVVTITRDDMLDFRQHWLPTVRRAALTNDTIRLDYGVPHISVEAEGGS